MGEVSVMIESANGAYQVLLRVNLALKWEMN